MRADALVSAALARQGISGETASRMAECCDVIVAGALAVRAAKRGAPVILNLCGSQGSGKSTMAEILRSLFAEAHGLAVATLSLDDLYLPKADRVVLAARVDPLFRTRGVPGTHDVGLGIDVIQHLVSASPGDITHLPRFDKLADDRRPSAEWDAFAGRADIVLFEGWCVGARPQAAAELVTPINPLEAECDPSGLWRRTVNDRLAADYQALFGLADRLIMLRAPSFEIVASWRKQQEQHLVAATGAAKVSMTDDEIDRFVMHYERLTRHMLAEMPARADILVSLDRDRNIIAIEN